MYVRRTLEGKAEAMGHARRAMIEARTAHSGCSKDNNGGIWAQKGKDGAGLKGHGGPPF
jgi:hypothetical protein